MNPVKLDDNEIIMTSVFLLTLPVTAALFFQCALCSKS